jgi:NAD(P)-dependent dehydrogenase (short-subunit alcohol dehydrogenase family)
MPNDEKRVAWVTGGGSEIGEAGAEALAADGWIVVVSGRRKDARDSVVAKITKACGKAEAIALDVRRKNDVIKAAEQILSRHGRIARMLHPEDLGRTICCRHAASGLRQRNPDQSDLEQGFCADAAQPGLG